MICHRMISFFRDANWLNADRAQAYMRMLAFGLLVAVVWIWIQDYGHAGRLPGANDFAAMWAGAKLAVTGDPAAAYITARTDAIARTASSMAARDTLPYFYPPVLLLLSYPLGFFSYLTAMNGFLAVTYGITLYGLLARTKQSWAILPLCGAPAMVVNFQSGQNGFLSGAAFALAALWLPRRPTLAGVALGILAFKPHLALMVPVVLLAARQWRALFASAASAAVLTGLSLWCFGIETWQRFFERAPVIAMVLRAHREDWERQLSAFTAARLLGAGFEAASVVQIMVVAATAVAVAWLCWRRPPLEALAPLMSAAAVLCSPHVMDYDLVVMMPAFAYVTVRGVQTGFLPWEKPGLLAAYLLPLVGRGFNVSFGVPIALPVLTMSFWLVARRVRECPAM